MDGDYFQHFGSPYTILNMQSFTGQAQAPAQGQMQYQYWGTPWQEYCQQPQRGVMIGQGALHASKQTEPKPRLAKDEVELLEREFAKNPKPTSNTKRELAEQMRVEAARINNWFQNRRAKEKQIKKTREFEAQQTTNRTASDSKSLEDQESGAVSEFYALSNSHQPAGPCSATIGEEEEDDGQEEEEKVEEEDPEEEREQGDEDDFRFEAQQVAADEPEKPASVTTGAPSLQPESCVDSETDEFGHTGSATPPSVTPIFTPENSSAVVQNSFGSTEVRPECHSATTYRDGLFKIPPTHLDLPTDFSVLGHLNPSEYLAEPPLISFPSEMIIGNAMGDDVGGTEPFHHYGFSKEAIQAGQRSPASMSQSPPPINNMKIRSPRPPTNIAARRNIRRPPSLGPGSIRNASHLHGPKSGIDVSRRTEASSPRWGIAPATAGLPGRVQKVGTAPRSSFSLERNRDALFHSLRGSGSPVLGSLNGSLSPRSPETLGLPENTPVPSVPGEDLGCAFDPWGSTRFKLEQMIRTPPETPGLPSELHLDFQQNMFCTPLENNWTSAPSDEPLQTPSLCSHGGSELEFSMGQSMPAYVASQPVTPSLPTSIGPTYGVRGRGPSNAEYHFPDSFPGCSTMSSPGLPKSKQFQFAQNVTPQDFNMER